MPTIDVDDEVFAKLQDDAEPLVDTPNSVLRRLYGLPPTGGAVAPPTEVPRRSGPRAARSAAKIVVSRGRGTGTVGRVAPRRRLARGKLLPEQEYELPILQVLDQAGGSAPTGDVIDRVGDILQDQFTDLEHEVTPSGDVRWRNRAQWARNNLVKRGLLDSDSPWGVWVMTDEGRAELERRRRLAHK